MFLCKFSIFTHPNPHRASQVTLSRPLLTISYVYILHSILPCLNIGSAHYMVSTHYTFISLLVYTTIPTIFSHSSSNHPIQIIHTTPTISTFLSKNLLSNDVVLISPCFLKGKHDGQYQCSQSARCYCSGSKNW